MYKKVATSITTIGFMSTSSDSCVARDRHGARGDSETQAAPNARPQPVEARRASATAAAVRRGSLKPRCAPSRAPAASAREVALARPRPRQVAGRRAPHEGAARGACADLHVSRKVIDDGHWHVATVVARDDHLPLHVEDVHRRRGLRGAMATRAARIAARQCECRSGWRGGWRRAWAVREAHGPAHGATPTMAAEAPSADASRLLQDPPPRLRPSVQPTTKGLYDGDRAMAFRGRGGRAQPPRGPSSWTTAERPRRLRPLPTRRAYRACTSVSVRGGGG